MKMEDGGTHGSGAGSAAALELPVGPERNGPEGSGRMAARAGGRQLARAAGEGDAHRAGSPAGKADSGRVAGARRLKGRRTSGVVHGGAWRNAGPPGSGGRPQRLCRPREREGRAVQANRGERGCGHGCCLWIPSCRSLDWWGDPYEGSPAAVRAGERCEPPRRRGSSHVSVTNTAGEKADS